MKPYLFSLLFLIGKAAGLSAQTGDGGGIQILNITVHNAFNYYHTPEYIIPKTDTALRIRHYILSDDDRHRVLRSYQPRDPGQYRISRQAQEPHIYIPYYLWEKGGKKDIFNQRLVLNYKGDSMIVDFIGIPGFNANGFTDVLNTLEFYPGSHIRLYRDLYSVHPELKERGQTAQRDTLYQLMRRGLSDTSFFYLREWKMLEDRTNYKEIILLKGEITDTISMENYPVYGLKPDQVTMDKADTGLLRISIPDPPIITGSGLQYRLLLNQFISFKENLRSNKKFSKEEQKALDIIEAFSTDSLYINGKGFSGTIMFYYYSYWDTISASGGTYDLIVSGYQNGRLIQTRKVHDVGYLNNDGPVVRPTGTMPGR